MSGPPTVANSVARMQALDRVLSMQGMLEKAAAGTGVDWTTLAAIAIRESHGIADKVQVGGLGRGLFQIDLGVFKNVTEAQAMDPAWSAHFAAQLLADNKSTILKGTLGLDTPAMNSYLEWMVISSYNTGAKGQINRLLSGNDPDWRTAPRGNNVYGNDYGKNVLDLKNCFN